ncbi:MAG: T9SS type A sorting domain-containing protein [Bacteroidetes bacterium]|nr:T9SS type A sorting domain-containing protein [Bacteroidota bacterium]
MKSILPVLGFLLLIHLASAQSGELYGLESRADSCMPPDQLTGSVSGDEAVLSWHAPVEPLQFAEKPRDINAQDTGIDISPVHRIIMNRQSQRDQWDVQFNFPLAVNDGEAGAESDGNYLYTAKWNGSSFYRYGIDGSLVGEFSIAGVERIRDLAYVENGGLMYGSDATDRLFIMDFNSVLPADSIVIPDIARALAYDHDQDVFYANNWSTDIMVIERLTGALVNSFPVGAYGNYYGFAYDDWSSGGPYLWGFSQSGSGAELVQIALPEGIETGFVMDLSFLSTAGTGIAGGLFTQSGLIPDKVTIGGVIQNDVFFGLELCNTGINFFLGGYNVYRNYVKLNTSPVADTFYIDSFLQPGTYRYEVTATYQDSLGVEICESEPSGPLMLTVDGDLVLGGNVFAGTGKLEDGSANGYKMHNGALIGEYQTGISTLGYYFFYPFGVNNYYVKAIPAEFSDYADNYAPTYYGDVIHWEEASLIHLEIDIYNADIHLVPFESVQPGNGVISGNIFTGTDSPAQGIPVMIFNENGSCIGIDYSDQNGYFTFKDLAWGNYYILGEIVGKTMNPVHFSITGSQPVVSGIQLIIMDNQIVQGIDENLPSWIRMITGIFPNPSSGEAWLTIYSEKATMIRKELLDLAGASIFSEKIMIHDGENRIRVHPGNLPAGMYILRIEAEGNVFSRKFISK